MSAAPHSFTSNGRDFEIRAIRTHDGVRVEAFENGKPIGVWGSVSLDTESDFAHVGQGPVEIVMVDAIERYIRDALESR